MTRGKTGHFFAARWHGEADLQVLLWRDVLVVGTLVNLAAGFAAFLMLSQNVAPIWALSVYLAPVPYNVFLLMSVWRSNQCTPLVSLIAGLWFVLVLII